jgi:hypothetical protein
MNDEFPTFSPRDSAQKPCAVQHVAQVLSGAEVVSEKRLLHKSEGVATAWLVKNIGDGTLTHTDRYR